MNKFLQKNSESLVSMFLGGLVVILAAVLAFNYFKNQNSQNLTENAPELSEEISEDATAAVKLPTTHTIVAGETLWSIAEKYYNNGFSYKEIAAANNIGDAKNLKVGTKLTIPITQVAAPLNVINRIDGTSYTVVKGDSLWQISVRAYNDGYRWLEIAKANNLTNPGIIHSGNVLTIPR